MMEYTERARRIRVNVLHMIHKAKASHIGSCYSCVDILTVLYGGILTIHRGRKHPETFPDRFILSKGHAAAALYATLYEWGFIGTEHIDKYCENGAMLGGHCTANVPGVEVSTGSLGHGLALGCGIALDGVKNWYRVFVVMSDGECDEGSVWESALFAGNNRLDNLCVIIDYNKLQGLGNVKDILDLEPFADKWRAFGWSVREIDGHDYKSIESALEEAPFEHGKPACIIAHTIKGKGVSFMENRVDWHYKFPTKEEVERALKELT